MENEAAMPRYRCHKEVYALKIQSIKTHHDGSATIQPEKPYQAFVVDKDWMSRFKGNNDDFGYFVLYMDGYQSWSPTKTFEGGYELVSSGQ